MNRMRVRKCIIILVIIALVSGSAVTIIGAIYSTRQGQSATILPDIVLTPGDIRQVGMGGITSVAAVEPSFTFYPDSTGKDHAKTAGGATIELDHGGGSLTILAGSFTQSSVCTDAFTWYRKKASGTAFTLDTGTSVIGERSARYSDSAGAALLIEKKDHVIAMVYELDSTGTTSAAPFPITALEALARILVARL